MRMPGSQQGKRSCGAEAQRVQATACVQSLKAVYTQETLKPWSKRTPAVDTGTHSLRLLVREDARGPSSCEIAVDFEGVPGAPLVGIDPVFAWISETGRQIHENGSLDCPQKPPQHFSLAVKCTARAIKPPTPPPFLSHSTLLFLRGA
uniref:Uncharacterized protein n=1 Tax=Mus musculus TaxID=10090 RepID=Q3TYX9_MOUSE|nr:unnamed protein product [Mus musculus]